jgi:hypothetical protein
MFVGTSKSPETSGRYGFETTYIADAAGTTIDYLTESFGSGNVASALIARAKAGSTVTPSF